MRRDLGRPERSIDFDGLLQYRNGQTHEAELDIDVRDEMLDNRKVFDEKSFGASASMSSFDLTRDLTPKN